MIRPTTTATVVFALGAVLAVGLASPDAVAAVDPPAQLQLDVAPSDDGTFTLRATLTRGGAVQSQETIQFFEFVDFFGERSIPLGTAVTDAAGVASLRYSPTSDGDQDLVARYAAADGSVASDPFRITVTGAVPAIPVEPPALPVVRAWAFPVGAAVLLLVWLFLLVILLRAVAGIVRPTDMRAISPTCTGRGRKGPRTPK